MGCGGIWGLGGASPSTVYCLQSNTRTTRVRGRGEVSPSKLSTILSTLQCSLQCSGRTTFSICIVASTMRYNSLDNTLYLESLLTITFPLPRYYHFLTTFAFSSLSLSRDCSSRVPTFSSLACSDFFKCYSDFSRLFATFR